MTVLHAQLDLLEGELPQALVGGARGVTKRSFAVLRLTRGDGTTGIGEASPLFGYSPDSIGEAANDLQALIDEPLDVDPLASPFDLLESAFEARPVATPSARFALEVALLDWLGQNRGTPLHQVLGGEAERQPIPIADLVLEPDPRDWPARADGLIADGATRLKLKIGAELGAEIAALQAIRTSHPTIPLRLDANRRLSLDALRAHASALESLELELLEEPVSPEQWARALDLPLPFALDETSREPERARRLLESDQIVAVVIKPMVLGGLRASFAAAELAAEHGAGYLVSHTFDGPIARAASAELALAMQTKLAAGLGVHAALELWPPHRIASIEGREIVPHDAPGLGLSFEEEPDE